MNRALLLCLETPLARALCGCLLATLSGCALIAPEITHEPVIRNPFPQLSRVAVAPFFNHSDEPTVDGREFALAYFAELQTTPGFEVAPLGVVEEAIIRHRIDLSDPNETRRLARILGVDAVVVGAITDFEAYYPPRCGLRVEWYTANPGYHQIPAGYGLPWNTPEEEFIPDRLVYEAQLAQARSEMAELAPQCETEVQPLPAPPEPASAVIGAAAFEPWEHPRLALADEELPSGAPDAATEQIELPGEALDGPADRGASPATPTAEPADTDFSSLIAAPDGVVDQHCDAADGRSCVPYAGPVLTHTQIYRGNDPDLTSALRGYVYFRDDARFGGWEGYLQRSDDFIRFCCHMHISEMLSARGGSRKTSVVWRWPDNR